MNRKQKAKLVDLQASEQRALFNKSSSAGTQSVPNMNSPSRVSDKESLMQDYQMQQEVNYVISKAMRTYNKSSERDLSLVQILKQFEQIVEEDANADEGEFEPQINPLQRSKIYLQLLKYKKAQELKELEEINDSIEQYKSTRTAKNNHGTFNSSTEVKTSDGRDQYLMATAAAGQQQPKSKRSTGNFDCQLIPEKQRANKQSNESSKVSMKLLRKDNDGSLGSESSNVKDKRQQVTQVHLKGAAGHYDGDQYRNFEESGGRLSKKLFDNESPERQLMYSGNYSVPLNEAVEREVQHINNRNLPKRDQYVTFSQDEELLQQSLQQNLKREFQSSALEQIDEGQEEMHQQQSPAHQTNQSDTLKFSIGYEQNFDTYQMNIYKRTTLPQKTGGSKSQRQNAKSTSQHSDPRSRKKSDSHSRGRTHSYALNASSASSKCRKGMTKKPSAELLPKKKYVSLRSGRYTKFAEFSKNAVQSPSLERRPENLVTEPPVKSVNNREQQNRSAISKPNSFKSQERTPSLHKSKSRSIGKRHINRQNDQQKSKAGSRSPAVAAASAGLKKDRFKSHRSPLVRQSIGRSVISSKSRDNNSIDRSYNNCLSASSVPFSYQGQKAETGVKKVQKPFSGKNESASGGEEASRLHYFNKLQENLKRQLDKEFHFDVLGQSSIRPESNQPDEVATSKGDMPLASIYAQVLNSKQAVEKGGPNLLPSTAQQEEAGNRTETNDAQRVPNKDLLSIRSQLHQTLNSGSSPTERYEVDQAIKREVVSSSKISGLRKSPYQDQGDGYIRKVQEFSENEEKSRWEVVSATNNPESSKRKHNFVPNEGRDEAIQLSRAQSRAGQTPLRSSRSQLRSRSPYSPRSRTSQSRRDLLQASSSTVMYSPLLPERKKKPTSAREQPELPVPYHVRSRDVQKQINDFIGQGGPNAATFRQETFNIHQSSSSSLPKQEVKGILKQGEWHHEQGRGGQSRQAQLVGDSSINQFKMFVMDQMKEEQPNDDGKNVMIIDQSKAPNDQNNRDSDDEDAFKLQRVTATRKSGQYEPRSVLPRAKPDLDQSNVKDTSQMLVHALHYEMNLMRKAFQVIQANSLINQTQRLNYKISKQRYLKSLKTKALRSIHMNYLNHFGHRNANQQAATLCKYLISRKYLTTWMTQFKRMVRHRAAIEEMRIRMAERMKMNVFVEWQQLQLSHQLYKAQNETAHSFWRDQAIKKSFLSLKFFTQFSMKRTRMQTMAFENLRHHLLAKTIVGLKRNITMQAQKKQRIQIAFRLCDVNLQRRALKNLQIGCWESLIERLNRKKARDFLIRKLLRVCWNHWRIFRIESEKERLNAKLGREFREQMLMRTLFNNLHIATKILREVYSPEKICELIARNRMRQCFGHLKVNKDVKVAIVNNLPQRLSFYYFANVWISDYKLTKYSLNPKSILVSNFEQKMRQYYLIKCFYTLFNTFESVKNMRDKRNLEVKMTIFNAIRRHYLKRAARRYKEQIIIEKMRFQKQANIFYSLKLITKRTANCKKLQAYVTSMRKEKLRMRIFDEWNRLQIGRQLKRQQKEISMKMNRDRYVTTYFSAWMQKYNTSQKKKYLNDVYKYYRIQRVRNKIFTQWIKQVTKMIDIQLRERQADFEYQRRRMHQVVKALKVHRIRRKREYLITQIIREKNDSIVAIKVIEHWRRRLHERLEKHQLYDQVVHDRNIRMMDIVFWTLKLNVEESKEQMVQQIAARRESETQMSQTQESQRSLVNE